MSKHNVAAFRRMHQAGTPLILPNAWDAASASLFAQAGAHAIATTSAGVAWSLGYRDGRAMPAAEAVDAAARMARVLDVPLSVDIENGYSDEPAEVASLVLHLASLGIAGINLEDGPDDPALLAAKIVAVRAALTAADVDLFINARCDVFLAGLVDADKRAGETIARGRRYAAAGADGLFVPAVSDTADIREIATNVPLPLNVMAWPDLPSAQDLAALGVKRLSAGSAIPQMVWDVAEHAAKAFLAGDTSEPVTKPFAAIQQLFPAV